MTGKLTKANEVFDELEFDVSILRNCNLLNFDGTEILVVSGNGQTVSGPLILWAGGEIKANKVSVYENGVNMDAYCPIADVDYTLIQDYNQYPTNTFDEVFLNWITSDPAELSIHLNNVLDN